MMGFNQIICRSISISSLVALCTIPPAIAQIDQSDPAIATEPFTSVSQLSDVRPTDWAYGALQSLIERYECGLQRNPFQGNQALTRSEFATGLNRCMEKTRPIAEIAKTDLETLGRLQSEFTTELKSLTDRVNSLTTSVEILDQQQFSTTTKLRGQAILALNAGRFSGDRVIAPRGALISRNQPSATRIYRVSFDLDTSFNGKDLLKTRLVTGSAGADDNAAGQLEPNLGSTLDFSIPGRNSRISIGRSYYTFSANPDLRITVGGFMVAPDFVDKNRYANNSFLDFSTQALVNNFILFPRPAGAGAAIDWHPKASPFSLRGVYIAGSGSSRIPENRPAIGGGETDIQLFPVGGGGANGGLFGDPYQGVLELEYAPSKTIAVKLQYGGGKLFGSNFNVFGVNAELALSDRIGLFARYGTASYPNTLLGDLSPQYWMAGVACRDLLMPKSIAGIAIGQPLIESTIGNATQTNMEAFFNFPVSDRVRITPLIQVVTNPANQATNGTIVSGTIRTVFSF
jgi:hypothetical protein